MQTRSGPRAAAQSTPRSTERPPGEGTPRWKSERCATRRPSSSTGNLGTTSSRVRSRGHPASKSPHETPSADALATNRANCKPDRREPAEDDDRRFIGQLTLIPPTLHRVRGRAPAAGAVVSAIPRGDLGAVDAPALVPVVRDRDEADEAGRQKADDRERVAPHPQPLQ